MNSLDYIGSAKIILGNTISQNLQCLFSGLVNF